MLAISMCGLILYFDKTRFILQCRLFINKGIDMCSVILVIDFNGTAYI